MCKYYKYFTVFLILFDLVGVFITAAMMKYSTLLSEAQDEVREYPDVQEENPKKQTGPFVPLDEENDDSSKDHETKEHA